MIAFSKGLFSAKSNNKYSQGQILLPQKIWNVLKKDKDEQFIIMIIKKDEKVDESKIVKSIENVKKAIQMEEEIAELMKKSMEGLE